MDLRQLKTFQMVASTLSFSQTATFLNYAQSSVTAQIQGLESELGVPLFDRLGRRVYLTAAGKQFQHYAERILGLAEEAQTVLSDSRALEGTLSIAAPETVFTYRIPPYLRLFRDRCPGAQLYFQPMLDVDSLRNLKNGALDVAFLLQEPLELEGLAAEPLVDEPLLVIAPPGHPLAEREAVRPVDLKGETILLTENGCGYRYLFEQELARAGMFSVIRLEFSSVEAIKQCVMSGLGVAFLPEIAVREQIEQGRLATLAWEKSFKACTQMVWQKDRWLGPVMAEFLETCRQMRQE